MPGSVAPPAPSAALPSSFVTSVGTDRCSGCHAARPTLMASAPKGLIYDTPALVETYAALIHKQVVELKVMPPGNMTQMTDAERAAIGRWFVSRD